MTDQRVSALHHPEPLVQLRDGTDLIIRTDGHLQFGTMPAHALILSLPPHVAVDQIHQVMRELRRPMQEPTVLRLLTHCGVPPVHARGILTELEKAGLLRTRPAGHHLRVQVTGPSLYTRAVVRELRRLDVPASGISPGTPAFGRLGPDDLVVMAGMLFPPADVSYLLMDLGVPHLTCGVVDARAVVGPLVLPGRTGCLSCLDAGYLDEDARWRTTRVQVTATPAPTSTRILELAAALTADAVRDLLDRRSTGAHATDWPLPEPLTGRRFIDPRQLSVTTTELHPRTGCSSCALVGHRAR